MKPHPTVVPLAGILLVATAMLSCSKETANPPEASFRYTSLSSYPVTVQFVNTSTSPGGPSTYLWDFGDGLTLTGNDATHMYLFPGAYNVRLVQIPSAGTNDTMTMALALGPQPGPSGVSSRFGAMQQANFQFTILPRPYVVTFINQSTGGSTYKLNFGDGLTSTLNSDTITHTYTPGNYHAVLTATNDDGIDTASVDLHF